MSLSFQLYSAREHGPWDDVFANLKRLGYTRVEGYGALYEDPEALAGQLAAHGLSMPTGHVAFAALEGDFAKALETVRTLGIETAYAPHLAPDERPDDADGWRAVGRRLAAIGRKLRDEGVAFGWHNHAFEVEPCGDGSVPLALLLEEAPDMGWEADLAWIVRGGADPLEWIASHGERIRAVHVKDLAADGENADEDGWADPGHGTMDWPALLDAVRGKAPDARLVAEHDKPADVERFARRAMESVTAWRGDDGARAGA